MKNLLYLFKPSQQNLFSAISTVLGIFILMHYRVEFVLWFIIVVALFTVAMDLIYKWCK